MRNFGYFQRPNEESPCSSIPRAEDPGLNPGQSRCKTEGEHQRPVGQEQSRVPQKQVDVVATTTGTTNFNGE